MVASQHVGIIDVDAKIFEKSTDTPHAKPAIANGLARSGKLSWFTFRLMVVTRSHRPIFPGKNVSDQTSFDRQRCARKSDALRF